MQAEQMDNMDELIREASKSHHPAYDDKSWEKMEALLDKHLPVKKDRRRPIIFFLLCLLIAGSAFFAILNLSPNKKQVIATESSSKMPGSPVPQKPLKLPDSPLLRTMPPVVTNDKRTDPLPGVGNSDAPQNARKLLLEKHLTNGRKSVPRSSDLPAGISTGIIPAAVNDPVLPATQAINDNDISPSYPPGLTDQQPVSSLGPPAGNDSIAAKHTAGTIANTAKEAVTTPQPAKSPGARKPAAKKGFANNFAVNLSAGPDLSFVGLANQSKGRLSYGAGLGYTFARRITVRTGFFVTKKTYSAKGDDYHPPASYWSYYSNLQKVYADCDIYEIPLSASYNFKETNGHNWFAGIGFSTLLMKKETYDYYYKDAWGRAMNKSWTLRNGGNQYFTVMTISGGYQYEITPRVSLSAEPYFKLPLQGIGFGKIKLNSGGILFTASIKPFLRRN